MTDNETPETGLPEDELDAQTGEPLTDRAAMTILPIDPTASDKFGSAIVPSPGLDEADAADTSTTQPVE